jgi:4-hydroxy-tetrahydrodipicolinate reductase
MVEEACWEADVTCLTTGIDPGFMNDIVPLTLMGVCGRVDRVRIQEILDYSTYAGSTAGMALGAPMEKQGVLEIPDVLIYAWGPTIYMMADAVGAELEKVDTVYEKWPTPEPIEFVKGVVEAGNCGAVRFEIRGWVGGRPAIVIEHVNRISNAAAPHWPRAKLEENDAYRITIEGSPNIVMETVFRGEKDNDPNSGGCLATGMRAIHSIPAVCAAGPGVVSALDLPLAPGRGTLR